MQTIGIQKISSGRGLARRASVESTSSVTVSPGFAYGLSARTPNMRTPFTLLCESNAVPPHARPNTAAIDAARTHRTTKERTRMTYISRRMPRLGRMGTPVANVDRVELKL